MDLIDSLYVNSKVGVILIDVSIIDPITVELIERMSGEYKNVYQIEIMDNSDIVN